MSYPEKVICFWFLTIPFLLSNQVTIAQKKAKPVIIGYVGGYRGNIIQTDSIDAKGLSHINYAFVDIKDNRAWLHNEITDTVNFRKLNELKTINPNLKILISIGGWIWSKLFSDAVLSDTSTANFAQSAVDIVSKFNLDGVDIDWEYPGMRGDSNVFRPKDRTGYTNLFKNLREKLEDLEKQTNKKYLVTTAIGGSVEFLQHTQMELAQEYLDYINLMSYDFDDTYDNMSAHHSNLYTPQAMPYIYSADACIKNLKKVGVKLSKVVLGIGFYGKGKIVESADNNGLYQIPIRPVFGGGYTYLKDSIVNQKGYVRYWDSESQAPYLFNAENKIFITYDDEESVKAKCLYIKKFKLAGAMFWEYFSDKKLYLLKGINSEFGYD
ncbi:MAG: glycoside hydrolase family 18 protein [Bacteroidetes bacterium]|nr:glycoside hydrolase family 18 protein [Bacteroidota bacterium]MBS1931729.1 glycoside hydrolase family 18 protein [Bacteroidota bacterium]